MRFLIAALALQKGDVVLLRHHDGTGYTTATITAEPTRDHAGVHLCTDAWPVHYTVPDKELIEVTALRRTHKLRCYACKETTERTHTLDTVWNRALLPPDALLRAVVLYQETELIIDGLCDGCTTKTLAPDTTP
jgi:hypothetical protein